MSYQVTARKWRPMVFEDVVGQSHVTTTLRNALSSKRVAHAYIFSGQRGCGKTTTARILAKAVNCEKPKDFNPDNNCESCKEITEGRSLDVIEIDGASNRGVEEIRNLREAVRYAPTRGKYKVYIIDEVHMLTKEAFNALLKTLEEPPPHVMFIFATTEVHKVPATILSRCQRFDFRRISIEEIMTRLRFIAGEEKVTIDEDALMVIAKKGDGSLRDSQSIFDQVRSFCGNTITHTDALKTLNAVDLDVYFKVTGLIREKSQRGGIELVEEIIKLGYDLREFVGGLAEHFRNLLVVLSTGAGDLVETTDHYRQKYVQEAKRFTDADLLRLIKQANELEQSLRWASQPRYKLEAALLQMITMESSVRVQDLLKQIDDLKKRLGNSAGLTTGAPAGVAGQESPGRPPKADVVKVVGTVSAGHMRSSAATAVSRDVASFSAPLRSAVPSLSAIPTAQVTSVLSGNGSLKSLSADEAYARWQEWIGTVRKEKISVGSILDESRILEVTNGAIRIACPDDYHLSALRRHKEYLVESFRKLTGYSVHIEPVVQFISPELSTPSSSTASVPSNGGNGKKASPGKANNGGNHPVIEALERELGAEKVE